MKKSRIAVLVVFFTFIFGNLSVSAFQGNDEVVTNAPNYENLVKKVNRSVVQLMVEEFGSGRGSGSEQSSFLARNLQTGSGVIVDSSGYIVTNAHVISGARTVKVLLPPLDTYNPKQESVLRSRGRVVDGKIVGYDEETDVGLIKIKDVDYPHLKFGNSDELRPGQTVLAFGSPLGLENSVSMGIISSTARQLSSEDPMIYIQTDAPINPGNSGGPLVNTKGEIMGINTLNFSLTGGSQGLGFASPSNIVKTIYKQLKEYGRVKRGVIGVYAQTIDPRMAQALHLNRNYKVILGDVYPGGPADFVGLKPGDIVVSMDGKIMENARQLNVNIYGKSIGSYIDLSIFRDGQVETKRVKVIERKDNETRFMDLINPERNFIDRLGILAVDANRDIRDALPPLRKRGGVLVAGSNGKAEVLGDPFKPGDVIFTMNGEQVDFETLKNKLNSFPPNTIVLFHIQRNNQLLYLSHELN